MASFAKPIGVLLCLGAGAAIALALALSVPEASAAKRRNRGHHQRADAGTAAAASARTPRPKPTTSAPPPAQAGSSLGCYYGKGVDGHTGRVRCLAPEELDPPLHVLADTRVFAEELGLLHGPEPGFELAPVSSADAGADDDPEGDEGSTSGAYKARVVSVAFENGVVGRAQSSLKKLNPKIAECVANEGGLKVQSARLKLMFLVRARSRAEGLIVASSRNIPPKVVRCITKVIENQPMGTPSNDPVGVTALFELKEKGN